MCGCLQLLTIINDYKPTAFLNGHDHALTLGQPATYNLWNNHTIYVTSGAGSWGETGDSCGVPGSWQYSNGGNGGFVVVTVNATIFQVTPCLGLSYDRAVRFYCLWHSHLVWQSSGGN